MLHRCLTIALLGLACLAGVAPLSADESALRGPIRDGDVFGLRDLLADGENPNAQDAAGATPLHWAAQIGNAVIVSLLLENRADVNVRNRQGRTPLALACAKSHADAALVLIAHGADVDLGDLQGTRPLDLAIRGNLTEVIQAVATRTKRLEHRLPGGDTLLHWSIRQPTHSTVDQLLRSGADPNARNESGETPLHLAAWEGDSVITAMLLAAEAQVNAADRSGRTPAHAAAWNNHVGVLHLLGADGVQSRPGVSGPLHAAAWQGHAEATAVLLRYGCDPSIRDTDQATPLHKAALRGQSDVIALLLKHPKTDRAAIDGAGLTALEYARRMFEEHRPTGPAVKRNWGVEQVIGKPDSPTAGDQVTAWASATADGQDEWLQLDFAKAVQPSTLEVYENCSPGALTRVTIFVDGREVEVWKGQDPTATTAASGVSKIKIDSKLKTSRVKLYLANTRVSGWNEIDAVALIDSQGGKQWVIEAQASSEYATGEAPKYPWRHAVKLLESE